MNSQPQNGYWVAAATRSDDGFVTWSGMPRFDTREAAISEADRKSRERPHMHFGARFIPTA